MRFEYRHFRPMKGFVERGGAIQCRRYMRGVSDWEPHERGGVTVCFAYDDNSEPTAMGLAFCSMKDNFSYRLGREITKGRALAGIRGEIPKQFKIWFLWGEVDDFFKVAEVIGVPS